LPNSVAARGAAFKIRGRSSRLPIDTYEANDFLLRPRLLLLMRHKRALMVGRKTILERKKYNGKIIETGVEIFS